MHRAWQRHALTFTVAFFLGLLVITGSFVDFANRIAALAVPVDPHADAIVVLTGGSARISAGLTLLDEKRARRLLISGVHPDTSPAALSRLTGFDARLFRCCVDLDRRAMNTVGNAIETRRWIRDHGYASLILVTSAYHLPRSRAELQGRMPEVTIIDYPVAADDHPIGAWWRNGETTRLLAVEYVKYVVAHLRLFLEGRQTNSAILSSLSSR